MTYPEFFRALQSQLQDKDEALSQYDILRAAIQSANEYSIRRPRKIMDSITGDGTTRSFPVPAHWQEEWSAILWIAPAGEDSIPLVAHLYRLAYQLNAGNTELVLRFDSAPSNGAIYDMLYIGVHEPFTIPDAHAYVVAGLGASIAAEWLATRYAQQTDTTMNLDIADRDARSVQFANRSRELNDIYNRTIPAARVNRRPLVRA